MRALNLSMVLLLGVSVWGGCAKDGSEEPKPGASQGGEAPPILPVTGTGPLTKLTDGQIAQILVAVDEAEIEQAKLALEKSTDADVRSYASHMVEQHTAAKDAGARLASQQSLKLDESPKTQELQTKSSKMLEQLKAADAKNFDVTYLQAQVDQHAEVLTMIKDQLQPAVNDTVLRDQLQSAQAMVTEHLEKAKQLQK